jgi:aryl-alcohol dehydrogenase-like predicted oxidoreductase
MEYRPIRNGPAVSAIALGAWELGGSGPGATVDQSVADEIVRAALDAGITLFDTAPGYGGGRSESMLGRALAGCRHRAIIATKYRNFEHWTRRDILESLRASLTRLNTDYADLLLMHWPKKNMTSGDADVMADAFAEAVRLGLARAVGLSNFQRVHLELLPPEALRLVVVNQMPASLLNRICESSGTSDFCARHGIALLAYSPLESGLLSGAYTRERRPAGGLLGGSRWLAPESYPRAMRVVDVLRAVAAECGRTPSQVALRWLMDRPGMASVLVGTTKVENLYNNLGAIGWTLSPEQRARLDAATPEAETASLSNP